MPQGDNWSRSAPNLHERRAALRAQQHRKRLHRRVPHDDAQRRQTVLAAQRHTGSLAGQRQRSGSRHGWRKHQPRLARAMQQAGRHISKRQAGQCRCCSQATFSTPRANGRGPEPAVPVLDIHDTQREARLRLCTGAWDHASPATDRCCMQQVHASTACPNTRRGSKSSSVCAMVRR